MNNAEYEEFLKKQKVKPEPKEPESEELTEEQYQEFLKDNDIKPSL